MTVDQARRLQSVARWHRRLALLVLLWLALLAASGIFINHANDWGLDRKALWQPLQELIYGIDVPDRDECDGIELPAEQCAEVFARIEMPGGVLLLERQAVYLVDQGGAVLERLAVSQLGLVTLEAGKAAGGLVYLQGREQVIVTDPELLESRRPSASELESARAYPWRKPDDVNVVITWERFFLDLHAARFFGPFSRVFNDLMAGLILLLAVSGFWLHKTKGQKS